MNSKREARLTSTLEKYARRTDTNEMSFAFSRGPWQWEWSATHARPNYLLAGVTKLFTTAIIMQLRAEGRLRLDEKVARYIGLEILGGLNTPGGVDRADEITVRHLLGNTSGVPDVFAHRRSDGSLLREEIYAADRGWSVSESLAEARALGAPFAPGTPGPALYSGTNFAILGLVIGVLDGRSLSESLTARIIEPLGLTNTYLFTPATLDRFSEVAAIHNGLADLRVPNAMASFGAAGSIVSTAAESRRLLEAFLGGELFPANYLDELTADWNPLHSPGQYGVRSWARYRLAYGLGLMRLDPRSPARLPAMTGHSGVTGSVLFRVADLHISGTINQTGNPSLAYNLLGRLARSGLR
jgi:CubicO group peptidase (beta-lactamase class C family)